jgi:hypothetical protein
MQKRKRPSYRPRSVNGLRKKLNETARLARVSIIATDPRRSRRRVAIDEGNTPAETTTSMDSPQDDNIGWH